LIAVGTRIDGTAVFLLEPDFISLLVSSFTTFAILEPSTPIRSWTLRVDNGDKLSGNARLFLRQPRRRCSRSLETPSDFNASLDLRSFRVTWLNGRAALGPPGSPRRRTGSRVCSCRVPPNNRSAGGKTNPRHGTPAAWPVLARTDLPPEIAYSIPHHTHRDTIPRHSRAYHTTRMRSAGIERPARCRQIRRAPQSPRSNPDTSSLPSHPQRLQPLPATPRRRR
jgi:hypothetical protein